jgi:hypothetical protein
MATPKVPSAGSTPRMPASNVPLGSGLNLPVATAGTPVGRVAAIAVPLAVDVGDQNAAPPAILRGGVQVVPPTVVTAKIDDFVSTLSSIARYALPRVLSQSVPANTRVAVGTTIDLVLVPVSDINLGLLSGMNQDLATSTLAVGDLLKVVNQGPVQAILQKTTDPATLSEADKATISNAYTAGTGFAINDADPSRNFAVTFNSLQSVRSFQ